MLKFFLSGVFFLITLPIFAQTDTVFLEPQSFLEQVALHHPVIKQAALLSETARQEIRLARGAFDPKIASQLNQKEFKAKEYYNKWYSDLKVPLWYGDLKLSYEKNSGEYLSTESTVPSDGLWALGLSLPIGQGLFIDQRRATLRQAQIFADIAEAEKVKAVNKLLLQALKDYWEWYRAFYQYQINKKGFTLAQFRFQAVVQDVLQGDLAGIDSVEAKITLQQREIDLKNSAVEFQNARLILSNHLWSANNEALELDSAMFPSPNYQGEAIVNLDELLQFAIENHPELQKIRFKGLQLNIKRKLDREMFKPVINLNYNLLTEPTGVSKVWEQQYWQDNYKFGFEFAFPLFLRKERAKYQLSGIKIQENDLMEVDLRRTIGNQLQSIYNNLVNLEELISLQENMIQNYKRLVDGEQDKFLNGESTIFYVNVREGKMLEAEQKLNELRFKYAKEKATLFWAAGKNPTY